MKVRIATGVLLVLIGLAGLYLGVIGWNAKRELVDTSVVEVAMTERETSPLLAALGGIALVTGLFTLWSGRDRSPV